MDVTTIQAEDLLRWRREMLQSGGRPSELDWLLEFEAGLSWQEQQRLRLDLRSSCTLAVSLARLEQLWLRRQQQHEPLQYLVGRSPWADLELQVGPGVLIPRQETEILLQLALQRVGCCDNHPGTVERWADLGTGSGCLAIGLALAMPQALGVAVDLSPAALVQAERNLQLYHVRDRVTLRQGCWWKPLHDQWGRLDLVVSNPPYIPNGVWDKLDPVVRWHEPELALRSGHDGLDAIRAIAQGAQSALTPGGWILLEHHYDQSAAVLKLLKQAGLEQISAERDLEGQLRFACGRRPAS